MAGAAQRDAQCLSEAGLFVRWLRRDPAIFVAEVRRSSDSMRLEWVRDSDFRFFPAVADPLFGYVLHPLNIATNKALAAADSQEPRDIVDLIFIDERILPLGAVIWAAVAKNPGFSPESLTGEIRRNARYRADDFSDLDERTRRCGRRFPAISRTSRKRRSICPLDAGRPGRLAVF